MYSFTRISVQQLRSDLEAAIKTVADKHNLIIQFSGGARFNPAECNFSKLKAIPKNTPTLEQKEASSPTAISRGQDPYNTLESREFINIGYMYALPKDWIGKKFNSNGSLYTIVGLKSSYRKYPVIGLSARGTRYKFSPMTVKSGIIL